MHSSLLLFLYATVDVVRQALGALGGFCQSLGAFYKLLCVIGAFLVERQGVTSVGVSGERGLLAAPAGLAQYEAARHFADACGVTQCEVWRIRVS